MGKSWKIVNEAMKHLKNLEEKIDPRKSADFAQRWEVNLPTNGGIQPATVESF